MKILISDYDGTIKTFDKNPTIIEKYIFKENIKFINNFIEDNNKFIIATGRDTNSIYNETKKYNIPYNYLISYNGRVIVDKDNNIINAEYIDDNFLNELDNFDIKNIYLFDEFKLNNNIDKPVYIYIELKNIKNVGKYISKWKEKYPNLEINYSFMINAIIVRKKYNKLLGINKLIEKENIDIKEENIFTVGDETNDAEMLYYYHGYRMLLSNPKLLTVTNNVTPSVYKLIKKIK